MTFRRHPLLLWAFALALAAGFASLGDWQLDKGAHKQRMLDAVAQTLRERRPQPPSVAAERARMAGYDWTTVAGRFADAPAVLLDNQQRQGAVGVRAYRLFIVDGGLPLLVDLGWLPLPPDRAMPSIPRDANARRLTGLLLPPPGKGLRLGPNQGAVALPDGSLLTTAIDLPRLGAALGQPRLALRVLRPERDPGFGYVRDFDILPNTLPPERHLGYAVQWFALSAAVMITALILSFLHVRKRRASARRSP